MVLKTLKKIPIEEYNQERAMDSGILKIPTYPASIQKMGPVVCYGMIGMGKSSGLKTVAEVAYDMGYKVLDLFSAGRGEGLYWNFKSDEKVWKGGKWGALESKEYDTHLLYPHFESSLPDSIPTEGDFFTIPFQKLGLEDYKSLLGFNVTTTSTSILNKIKYTYTKKDMSSAEFMHYLKKEGSSKGAGEDISARSANIYYNLLPLYKEKFLGSLTDKNVLDLKRELKNRKTVTSLMLKHTNPDYWGFIVNHFITQMNQLALRDEINKVFYIIREATIFLSRGGEKSDSEKAVRDSIARSIRLSRTKSVYPGLDLQDPSDLHPSVKGNTYLLLCYRLQDWKKIEDALETEMKGLLTQQDLIKVTKLPPGTCLAIRQITSAESRYNLPNHVITSMLYPKSRIWKEDDDIYQIYRKVKGYTNMINSDIKNFDILKDFSEGESKLAVIIDRERLKKRMESKEGKEILKAGKKAEGEELEGKKKEKKEVRDEIKKKRFVKEILIVPRNEKVADDILNSMEFDF